MRKILLTFFTALLCSVTAWGASGDVLFSQDFGSVTALEYRYTTGTVTETRDYNTTTTLSGLVGTGTNLFTSFKSSIKKGDIAINSSSGGNSVDASGFFQAYSNGDNAGYWSLTRTSDFAVTAPTALKITMDIWYKNISSGSTNGVQFAIGDGFTDGLVSTTAQTNANVHSGFGLYANSTSKLNAYNSTTALYATAITQSTWLSITWVINNTGKSLTYDNPTGSGTTTLANDKFDIWLKTQAGAASTYSKVVNAASATTASKDLQEIYIGYNQSGKKHEFRLDNIVVTDLTPSSCTSITPTLSYASVGGTTLAIGGSSSGSPTVGGNTGSGAVTYAITATPSGCATINNSTGVVTGVHAGTATVTATVAAASTYCSGTATANFTISCNSITPTFSTDYTSTTLTVGGGNSSTPVVYKDGSSGAISWTSSAPAKATVNSSGVVTPVAAGSATITATVAANGDYCEGTVSKSFTIVEDSCTDPELTITLN